RDVGKGGQIHANTEARQRLTELFCGPCRLGLIEKILQETMHSFHYSQKDSLPLFNRNSCTAGQKKGSEADLAALGRVAEFVSLSSETNADCRKGAIEAKRLGLPRVYPPIHCSQEKICAVAKTKLGI